MNRNRRNYTYGNQDENEGAVKAQSSRILIVDDNHFSAIALLT